MQKKTRTLVSVLLAGTLLLGVVSVAAADSTTSTSVSQSIKTLCQKGHGAQTPAQMETQMQTKLKTLVDKGTITQAQADKVVAYLKKMQETRKADFAKVKNMTQAERDKFKNPLAQLVTDKGLTQEQADAIAKLMPMHKGKGMKGDLAANQTKMKEILSGLVDKGTLTQKQMDSIITAMDKMRQERQADMEKMKNMTPEERQTYMQQLKGKKTSPIEQLVKDNVITSEQADAIRDAMPQRSGQHRR